MIRLLASFCAALMATCPGPLGAQQVGRLFHTPAERSALDALRKAKPQPQKPAARPAGEAQSARLDGYVTRSDGKSTLWVNGNTVARTR